MENTIFFLMFSSIDNVTMFCPWLWVVSYIRYRILNYGLKLIFLLGYNKSSTACEYAGGNIYCCKTVKPNFITLLYCSHSDEEKGTLSHSILWNHNDQDPRQYLVISQNIGPHLLIYLAFQVSHIRIKSSHDYPHMLNVFPLAWS